MRQVKSMPFGGAQPPEAVRKSKSASKRINASLHFWRASIKSTVLVGHRESLIRTPAKASLGARSLFLPLELGKDSQQELS